jgi:hypothetical protein
LAAGKVVSQILESWTSIYANHGALRTAIEFVHIGGLVAGGGCAIAADLATITAARAGAERATQLQLLQKTHRIVILGLVALTISGLLLFGADVETFAYSRVFWLKMALLVVLLGNGALMQRGERRVQRGESGAWSQLHRTATISLVLWFFTTLAGAALPNIG